MMQDKLDATARKFEQSKIDYRKAAEEVKLAKIKAERAEKRCTELMIKSDGLLKELYDIQRSEATTESEIDQACDELTENLQTLTERINETRLAMKNGDHDSMVRGASLMVEVGCKMGQASKTVKSAGARMMYIAHRNKLSSDPVSSDPVSSDPVSSDHSDDDCDDAIEARKILESRIRQRFDENLEETLASLAESGVPLNAEKISVSTSVIVC